MEMKPPISRAKMILITKAAIKAIKVKYKKKKIKLYEQQCFIISLVSKYSGFPNLSFGDGLFYLLLRLLSRNKWVVNIIPWFWTRSKMPAWFFLSCCFFMLHPLECCDFCVIKLNIAGCNCTSTCETSADCVERESRRLSLILDKLCALCAHWHTSALGLGFPHGIFFSMPD